MKLIDLIGVDILQRIQDSFSKFTGMASITTDENGIPITKGSNFSAFCMELTRGTVLGNRRCEECDKMGAIRTLESGNATTYFCHAGLMDFAAPIMLNDKMIGCIIGGQVRTAEVDEDAMIKVANEIGVEPQKYIEAAKKTKVLNEEYIDKSATYLAEIAGIISGMAYQSSLALQKSRELEQNAQIQARYTVKQMVKLKKELNHWSSVMNSVDKSQLPIEAKKLLNSFNTMTYDTVAEIQNTEEYLNISLGNVQLKEEVYNVRDQIREFLNGFGLYNEEIFDHVNVSIDEDVPEYLLGDCGRISMVVAKVFQKEMEYMQDEKFYFYVSAEKKGYTTWLKIRIGEQGKGLPQATGERMKHEMGRNGFASAENISGAMDEVTMLAMVIRQMSGTIDVEGEEGKWSEYIIQIPQLEIVGGDENDL